MCEMFRLFPGNIANDGTLTFLVDANKKSEWMWAFYLKFALCANASNVMFLIISIYICWSAAAGFDAKHLYRPFKWWFV